MTTREPIVTSVDVHVFRAPIARPVVNAFGAITDRPMALVRIVDSDGFAGWGEIWCNFPNVGAEHRARLVASVLAPLLIGQPASDPEAQFTRLSRAVASQVLQTGEAGPFAQCIAGVDQALTDLAARRAGRPLWRHLGGTSAKVRVYASGIGPNDIEPVATQHWNAGFHAFKLKVGFGRERDLANLEAIRRALATNAIVMTDANQAWTSADAASMAREMKPFRLAWLEEPIAADSPWPVWQTLAATAPMPLAAGENLRGESAFEAAIASRSLGVLQPDIGKWCGFSRGVAIGRHAVASGMRFCPHWLAGGVGLMASLHLLAAVGGDGFAEWDANPNPLRERFALPGVVDGAVTLPDAPGLGFEPELEAFAEFAVSY
ncbi:MAG TPA: mandelate racemase/muconate lactonizing enzyme family protein [Casimicrobiaceae bacterium]|nr:mandelate racemase/muconate lactonizing enzyme family protein [Casimicrobiaceae bacterium]